jgi:hypothetical protein
VIILKVRSVMVNLLDKHDCLKDLVPTILPLSHLHPESKDRPNATTCHVKNSIHYQQGPSLQSNATNHISIAANLSVLWGFLEGCMFVRSWWVSLVGYIDYCISSSTSTKSIKALTVVHDFASCRRSPALILSFKARLIAGNNG